MKKINKKLFEKTLRPDRQRSYRLIVHYIMKNVQPALKSVIDYGCGAGWFLYYFKKDFGINDILGLEPSPSAMLIADPLVRDDVMPLSLTDFIIFRRNFDLAMNIEVAEHINKKFADRIVKNITRYSDLLIFSAAVPGQGGVGHVNEQPFEFWKNKICDTGFSFKEEETQKFRQFLKKKKAKKWYYNNLAIFRKETKDANF